MIEGAGLESKLCPVCKGAGRRLGYYGLYRCPKCKGQGVYTPWREKLSDMWTEVLLGR